MTDPHRRRDRMISLAMFLALAGVWQILSIVYTAEAQPGEPMVAGWQVLFTKTFLSLAYYWQGGFGVPAVADGAERSCLAALLPSFRTQPIRSPTGGRPCARRRRRPSAGTGDVMVAVDSASVDLPIQFLRSLPLLAMVPLFQRWFGTYVIGEVLFVSYGIGVIVFAGSVNAVRNVPQIYLDNARSLGASQATL